MTESINFPNLGIHLEHVGQKMEEIPGDVDTEESTDHTFTGAKAENVTFAYKVSETET